MIALAEASAFIAVAALSTGLADLVLLSVLTVYSVCSGNEQQLMTYVSLLMTALMGTCIAYDAYGQVTVIGEKGSQTFDTDTVKKGAANNKTYYHVTTKENAELIKASGQLKRGRYEAGVFVWNQRPTREQAGLAGVGNRTQVVLKFETSAAFEDDTGVDAWLIPYVRKSVFDTVNIFNVEEVDFKK